ncbi:hypothetical protein ABW20_dc0108238 [Dactylellina cionopaga]|nr:hypothetical protein ABW20_dc0108238 [Dactylellina cionopaga]
MHDRPENLVLHDDPTFVPELAFILPEFFRLPEEQLHHTTQLTFEDRTLLTSELLGTALQIQGYSPPSIGQLVVPDSSSLGGSGLGFQSSLGDGFRGGKSCQEQIDDDINFIFDANGELQDALTGLPMPLERVLEEGSQEPPLEEDGIVEIPKRNRWEVMSVGSERVRREHDEGKGGMNEAENLVDFDKFQYEPISMAGSPKAKPFPRREKQRKEVETVVLASRKPEKKIRLARFDDTLELKTSELAAFSSNYSKNMEQIRQKRSQMQKIYMAKNCALENPKSLDEDHIS